MRSRSVTLWILFLLGACGRSGLRHGVAGTGGSSGGDGTGEGSAGIGGASTTTLVDCGYPAALGNGSVSGRFTTYGSVATYSCAAGYALSGSAVRTCQANGMWSGTAPVCVISNCPIGETECNAVCLDAQTDNDNCGFCGNVCSAISPSTAQFTAGRCLVTLATGNSQPRHIAVDATSVYWTNDHDGTVMKIAKGGGTFTTLASGQFPSGIVCTNSRSRASLCPRCGALFKLCSSWASWRASRCSIGEVANTEPGNRANQRQGSGRR